MNRIGMASKRYFAILACCAGLLVSGTTQAQPAIRIVGNAYYDYTATNAFLAVDEIINLSVLQGISSSVRLELWAFPFPFTGVNQAGYQQAGHLMATYDLGPLTEGHYFPNVYSGPVPFSPPPPGDWYVTLLVTEYNGGFHNAFGFLPTDYFNFPSERFATATATVQSAPQVVPKPGLWWNPNESGSGYSIDYKNGILVVTVFSYKSNGEPQWYLAAGPLHGPDFTATLDKYSAGQCISCAFAGRPTLAGNDGMININFASSTSATVKLPGGRVTQIQPQEF